MSRPSTLGVWRRASLVASILAAAWAAEVHAADTGLLPATNVVAAGTWTTFMVGQLNTSDNAWATVTANNSFGVLNNFGFVIPGAAAISGIEVQVEGSDNTAAQTVNYSVQLSWNNGATWTNAQNGTFTGTTDVTTVLGPGSLWGRAWTPAELGNANFRLQIFRTGGTGDLRVDRIQVRVSYYVLPWPAGTMQFRTGSYVGNGTNGRAITGLGFQPDVVLVIPDATCNGLPGQSLPCGRTSVIRTSTMGAGDVSGSGYGYFYPPLVNRIQSLDGDGFTVGEPPDHNVPNDDPIQPYHCVNHNGTRYYWTAFKAAAGELELGTYVGDGAATRDITTLSFRPDYVLVTSAEGERILERTSLMPVDYSFDIEGGAYCPPCVQPPAIRDMLANGFRIGSFGNGNTATFHYVAWKALPGRMAVGQYTGTGFDDRSITGVGFRPDYVAVHQGTPIPPNSSTTVKTGWMGSASTDLSFPHINYGGPWNPTDAIQALEADGFQVGTNVGVNGAGNTYYWVAFGPGSGPMTVRSGSYVGDGVDGRAILVGFQPDLVFVKRDENTRFTQVRTSTMIGDLTKPVDTGGTTSYAGGIKSLDPSGFTLGANPNVNAVGAPYYWIAFKAGPGEMKLGSYAGNDIDSTNITGVGFQPDYMMVFPEGGFAPMNRTSSMAVDESYDFDAAQWTDRIQLLQSDGFQVGGNPDVNKSGQTYHYAAWKAVPGRMAVGQYTGNGVANRNLNVTTFTPEWVLVKRAGISRPWVHKPASTGVNVDYSLYLSDFVGNSGDIQQILPLGFQVGFGPEVPDRTNDSGIVYYWAAFGPHTETYLRSIGAAPNYGVGSVSVTSGSAAVTGIGTLWKTNNRGRGDRITINAVDYTILGVTSETQLTLTSPFVGTSGTYTYTIARKFVDLPSWNDCVHQVAACPGVISPNLVTDRRREVGIAYRDVGGTTFTLAATLLIDGGTTDSSHDITLTADGVNRHYGLPGTGVVIENNGNSIRPNDAYVTLEWLEIINTVGGRAFHLSTPVSSPQKAVIRYNLLHNNNASQMIRFFAQHDADIYSNIIYTAARGIDMQTFASTVNIYNNTIYNTTGNAIVGTAGTVTLRNNIAHTCATCYSVPTRTAASSNNLASDATATSVNPAADNALWNGVPLAAMNFVNTAAGNLHILAGSRAQDQAANLASLFNFDIDATLRQAPWDMGADDISGTTAVTLQSFAAAPGDGAVDLSWATASELQNLGFHLYRADSADGPYTRITSSLIPGLGSSPTGQSYAHRDTGLVNGRTYYYELEDVETTGKTQRHGPVSATPSPAAGSPPAPPPPDPSATTYGDPSGVVLREIERDARHVVVELLTGGFTASPADGGRVRLAIPGFESASGPGKPDLPMRRALVEAAAGRRVRLASVVASDVLHFAGLRPVAEGTPGVEVTGDGSVVTSSTTVTEGAAFSGLFPAVSARLEGTVFQGETKKANLLLSPLRWDGNSLELSRRLVVRLDFARTEGAERSLGGSRGRRVVSRGSHGRSGVVAQLVLKDRGLHRVDYGDVFSGRSEVLASNLRLSRQGTSVAFHVEPNPGRFGPGSSLYFLSEGSSLNPYGDAVYELETGPRGTLMPVERLIPDSTPVSEEIATLLREENRYYQAGLLDAPDLWLWDIVVSPASKSYPFTVDHVSSLSPGRVSVSMQGASDFEGVTDHHVKVRVNGVMVGEGTWDGRRPQTLDFEVGAGTLQEGQNSLDLENVGDTGAAYSFVFLNRFSLHYPRTLVATQGTLEGSFAVSGQAAIDGLSSASLLLDTTESPRWLTGGSATASGLSFPVQAGRSYLATTTVLRPEVRRIQARSLKDATNRADYLLLAPKAFLTAAQPLLDWRENQGLVTKAVSLEDVYEQFGHGETSPAAIKEFLEYAYQFWASPSPRYVLLLGDASYDPKDYLKTGVLNWLPGFPVKTSYLWTVSDPAYASVNGNDLVPDVAIGRLPAGSVEEAQRLVQKVLAFENGGGNFDGPSVLVADNADLAGNFEQDADEIAATILASRNPRKIYYSREGANTRAEIEDAFDQGASFLSYVGHGGTVVWASENIFNYQDVASLRPQSQQPLLLTMNCLNGFFHFPPLNSLSEELLKADGKGVIAAFSPSGLSVNDAAHLYHKAVLQEILSGKYERLGDAILAAQEDYAHTGAFPELLSIYHLFGDPALRIR